MNETKETTHSKARQDKLGCQWFEKNVVSWHLLCRYRKEELGGSQKDSIGPAFRVTSRASS
jgi:hypothetical protein